MSDPADTAASPAMGSTAGAELRFTWLWKIPVAALLAMAAVPSTGRLAAAANTDASQPALNRDKLSNVAFISGFPFGSSGTCRFSMR